MSVTIGEGLSGFGMAGSTQKSKSTGVDASQQFSEILDKMKKGQSPSLGGDDSKDEDTVTVTRILSDGSTIITTMKDGKIVSQTKTHAAVEQDEPKLMDTVVDKGIGKADEAGDAMAASAAASVLSSDILSLLK